MGVISDSVILSFVVGAFGKRGFIRVFEECQ